MGQHLLAGIAVVALVVWQPAARATPFDFTYSGNIVGFTVPNTDTYRILAFGASGGEGFVGGGGGGAEIGGDFSLMAGEVLQIAVGGRGFSNINIINPGGGGGGSFVVGPGALPLVIAGGGGGGGGNLNVIIPVKGGDGLTGGDGGNGGGRNGGPGGTGGSGGVASFFDGSAHLKRRRRRLFQRGEPPRHRRR